MHGHIEIGGRAVAVVCRDDAGIYAVEKLLKQRWGDQLALVALEKEPGHYTLRRVSTLSSFNLTDAYGLLNQLDRNVDGRPPNKRWGGSESIGGSPRGSGSAFSPNELLRVLGQAYAPVSRWARLRTTFQAALCALAIVVLGLGAATRSTPATAPPRRGRASAPYWCSARWPFRAAPASAGSGCTVGAGPAAPAGSCRPRARRCWQCRCAACSCRPPPGRWPKRAAHSA